MTINVYVVIPVAPAHRGNVTLAINSVNDQRVPDNVEVKAVVGYDDTMQGSARTRNTLVNGLKGGFTAFLDADDTLLPDAVLTMLKTWEPNSYVWGAWNVNGQPVNVPALPANVGVRGMFHPITTLIPTNAVQYVGGFNEDLPTLEDEDFYFKLYYAGLCPVKTPHVIFNYNRSLGTSLSNEDTAAKSERWQAILKHREYLERTYGHLRGLDMCKCKQVAVPANFNVKQPPNEDYVLAVALYAPKKVKGPSGITYPKMPMNSTFYVHKVDAESRSDLWHVVPDVNKINPDLDTLREVVALKAV